MLFDLTKVENKAFSLLRNYWNTNQIKSIGKLDPEISRYSNSSFDYKVLDIYQDATKPQQECLKKLTPIPLFVVENN